MSCFGTDPCLVTFRIFVRSKGSRLLFDYFVWRGRLMHKPKNHAMKYKEFAKYYEEFKHKIYSYLYYRSGRNKDLAEDLTAEVFLKAFEKFHTYKEGSSFKSWIYAVAHNHLVDHYRKNRESVDLELIENVVESEMDTRVLLEKRLAVEQAEELLEYLTDEEREIVLLRYHRDLSMREIGDVVDKEEVTVRVMVHRALGKMRKKYDVLYALITLIFITLV